ncbi:cupin domain-containing protein [Flammeovirga yaeyamensis]|uniref:glucose-6-phosphate isomerase n=1 Tax=Flammeovirga yaeyamensis TaxID=367791 RepID=A0AAX1NBB3_9BACT|nr:glucose-6-phosphate isomerase family protein [Flammeovirga yaeyamensis]MBB3697239.1 glucose-6-phosphate isomerase [Flammeovirga yaeyamensis]NMF33897.1 cupin domain-containing protein [Flammeovirga yaeyamensis]QWG04843.1 cupin domain-containing protein [Flammeovirga yaeyamensis]
MPTIQLEITSGKLAGEGVITAQKKLSQLENVFQDEATRKSMDQDQLIYEVQAYMPVEEGKEGGLYFGNSTIFPGKVNNEYFMTRGHFHTKLDTAEYYWCIQGKGALILMDEEGKTWLEEMTPGSVHYIPGKIAHRVANTGDEKLVFNACWPSEAGHDYATIEKDGFGARLMEVDGKPQLVQNKKEMV